MKDPQKNADDLEKRCDALNETLTWFKRQIKEQEDLLSQKRQEAKQWQSLIEEASREYFKVKDELEDIKTQRCYAKLGGR